MCTNDYDLSKKYDFKRIIIDKDFDPDQPTVPCTATRIEQVVINLLRNAAQAMPERTNTSEPAQDNASEHGMRRIAS